MFDDLLDIVLWAWALTFLTEHGGKNGRVRCSWQCSGGELQYNWWLEVATEPVELKATE